MSDGLIHGEITEESLAKMRARIGTPNPTLRTGFVDWPWNETASIDSIRQYTHGYGDLNPLYTNPEYAAGTRWGTVIAPPGYEWTMGIDRSPTVSDELREATRGALRGVHLFNAGHEGWYYRPITPGTRLYRSSVLADVEVKKSEFAGTSAIATNEHRWYDEDGTTYAIRRPWYIHAERKKVDSDNKYAKDQRAHYTDAEIDAIDAAYDAEYIRGDDTLYYEDAHIGTQLPPMVKGPLTITDLMNFFMGAGWYGYGFPALRLARENRRTLRGFYSRNDFNSWDAIMRIHWEDHTARDIGVPAAYDIGPIRWTWLTHYCTNYAGNNGWVFNVRAEFRRFNYIGDTTWITGHITDKRIDPQHGPLIELQLTGTNQRHQQNIRGTATILLPSHQHGPIQLPTHQPQNTH
ncbi:MaoC family dehydratase N-terminal domain-containing protein [Nocardia abscessus]|jgi:acyl dehydratase|uniref:FAS1-like dehydratase domain-containing protein n=1 Tax=Nocardia TaxID=1817 RepID=UPI001895A119|nr:MaoC family dehydratase N-terminal domain-containing protein [Nocardia abscessus]MBF6207821.1 MaoC family dehydratase N-terminal domain-containing protein [Streptomyces gardneri]MBF6472614.1 MaoC family dehydratase N-terminal domain-containing protein [Nocardia abscessus]